MCGCVDKSGNWVIISSKVIVSCHTQHKKNTTPLTLTLTHLNFSERGLGTRIRLKQGCTINVYRNMTGLSVDVLSV